jgi:hypothetical protein
MNAKTFIFNHFARFPMVQWMSFLTPKNLRFMTDFHQHQFVHKSQKICVHLRLKTASLSKVKQGFSIPPGGVSPKSHTSTTSAASQTIATAPLAAIHNSKLNAQNYRNLPLKIRDL